MCSAQSASSNVTCSVRSGETSVFTPGVAMRADVLFSSLYHQAYYDLFQEITSLTGTSALTQAGSLPCIHKAMPVCVRACFHLDQAMHPERTARTHHSATCMCLQGPCAILRFTQSSRVVMSCPSTCLHVGQQQCVALEITVSGAQTVLVCECRMTVVLGSSPCCLRSWWRGW